MSERVFDICQIGTQGGSFTSPGSAAAATFLYPIDSAVNPELDRASQYPVQDRGRNSRNAAGQGYHGVRGSSVTLPSQLRFEDFADLAEMHWAGGIAATGSGPYTRVYPFEVGAPTLVPATIQLAGIDATEASMRLVSCLIDSMTLSFGDITAPGASPWTLSASVMGLDREISAYTASLSAKAGLETVQGHLTRLYEGPTGTAFASLTEAASSLKSFSITTNRFLRRRAYGGSTDVATKFGFGEQSNGTIEAKVAVSSTGKSDYHDIWNAAAPAALGE
ncbi:MAG: hypothetical protein JO246_14075, partial [Frankiaceae bacterium]|nr:hypothetical protein [Frankiaceae bacterium]